MGCSLGSEQQNLDEIEAVERAVRAQRVCRNTSHTPTPGRSSVGGRERRRAKPPKRGMEGSREGVGGREDDCGSEQNRTEQNTIRTEQNTIRTEHDQNRPERPEQKQSRTGASTSDRGSEERTPGRSITRPPDPQRGDHAVVRTEPNRTEQNRTEQKPNRTEQGPSHPPSR